MEKDELRSLAEEHLVPFIPGSRLEKNTLNSKPNTKLVAPQMSGKIGFKANSDDVYRLLLARDYPFSKSTEEEVTEVDVVTAFVRVVPAMRKGLDAWYQADLRSALPRRVVAWALGKSKEYAMSILAAIDQLSHWAQRSYEGKPVPAAFGFERNSTKKGLHIESFCKLDFCSVLSNGFDTMLTCNMQGEVIGHEQINKNTKEVGFSPIRLTGIANWTKGGNIALSLNRSGEIFAFVNGELVFVRRGGRWHFLTHSYATSRIADISNEPLSEAIYQTAIDASFAKTGACIGITSAEDNDIWKSVVPQKRDWLSHRNSDKTQALRNFIKGKRFHFIDRRLRQELVAIDGAIVLDNEGKVLSVGAILRINGGSLGGGRLAAAKTLSSLGMGIKVSQDGCIQAFAGSDAVEVFSLMS